MFKIKHKLCDPFMASLGVGSALLGGLGTLHTNKTNKQIAESNNRTMLKAMREQTKSEQDYNSISEQMKRAMMAGINPMLMAGAQPTSASSAGVPSLDTPVMENPFKAFPSAGSSMAQAHLQSKQLGLQDESLDISRFESKVDLLKTVASLAGTADLKADDINMILRSVIGDDYEGSDLTAFARDEFTSVRLRNAVQSSDMDLKQKQYLFSWLDKMTNAQYSNLLADTEVKSTQTGVNRGNVSLMKTQEQVNKSIASLNEIKRKEIKQAILNMREQWKSLNAQASMDVYKMKNFAEYFDAQVKQLQEEAKLTETEATYWIWSKVRETQPEVLNVGSYIPEHERPNFGINF